jgi:hypothetical protein
MSAGPAVHTRHHFDERTEVRDVLDAAYVDLVLSGITVSSSTIAIAFCATTLSDDAMLMQP